MRDLSSSTTSSTLGSAAAAAGALRHARVVRVNLAGRGLSSRLLPPPVDSYPTRPRSSSSSIPVGIGTLTSSGSDSKLWRNRRTRLVLSRWRSRSSPNFYFMPSLYRRIFKLVFFLCLFLFLHALFGIGVPRIDLDSDPGPDTSADRRRSTWIHSGNRTAAGKVKDGAFAGLGHHYDQHHHLALDSDGHYTYPLAFQADGGRAYTWGWARRTSTAREPRPTDDSHVPSKDDTSTARERDARSSEEARQAHVEKEEPEVEMDPPMFDLGDPVHALRVHLPVTAQSSPPSDQHRRGRRARAHGQMLL